MPERNREMGHWCRICDRNRANEKFSAKGHKNHICEDCAKKPKEDIEIIDQRARNLSLFESVKYFGEKSVEA
jgi:protein-arginine kinase activator protein McsA